MSAECLYLSGIPKWNHKTLGTLQKEVTEKMNELEDWKECCEVCFSGCYIAVVLMNSPQL